jgi:hypothetical protein
MNRYIAIAAMMAAVLTGCATDDDVGELCPMQAPSSTVGNETGSQYPRDVEINTDFPCDSLTCVNTDGRPSYCSRECQSDTGCPSAFLCQEVIAIGPLAGRKYCVWRGCRAQLECGDVKKFDCIEGNYGPLSPPGLCGHIGDDATANESAQ